jgi:hypothetical protein
MGRLFRDALILAPLLLSLLHDSLSKASCHSLNEKVEASIQIHSLLPVKMVFQRRDSREAEIQNLASTPTPLASSIYLLISFL